ncbi:tRNA(1)(Val) (adenine(37)-N(6))-methyltransferase TrmN [Rouxiella chamberiensis]|uniref:tRNA1(Val) (adenine(37)-N6)-methyltransferase n=1 Tax=Rouxiella chamberiensis TaxID=1513468 RepID=A0ABY7HKX4_9GAMM|nr:tRNA1(Val) (adenine(37)-N6)-methyltransferase [Rouxiella chamberiensis]WAT00021.1 tRNA1(Val) (adenine(37)-N6)-methyltransferase [Rouxiella chamberiensis]
MTEAGANKPLRRNGFTFKQFFVAHDRCAMKVGTDGVLLGAWSPINAQVTHILDIGTGTGLVALMLAQRSAESVRVDAVELESSAAEQAQENFAESPWSSRLSVFSEDINQFAERSTRRYDLIVSNPPYFESAVACRDEARNAARYTETLTHQALLECAARLLSTNGIFCVVLPYEIGLTFEQTAQQQGWHTHSRLDIRDRPEKPLNRMLLALGSQPGEAVRQTLDLREKLNVYSAEFKGLIADFYLNY